MKIDRVIVGSLETNCYILSINNDCLVIDPGDEYYKIKEKIGNKNVIGVLITHHHFDHVGELNNFNKDIIYDKNNLKEGKNKIGNFTFNIIYTPGHKEDSITIYFEEESIMFTGDFLFKGALGRTDLPGGNDIEMLNSLNKISKYNKNIKIYPGHGDFSYLKNELTK